MFFFQQQVKIRFSPEVTKGNQIQHELKYLSPEYCGLSVCAVEDSQDSTNMGEPEKEFVLL